MKQDNTPTWAYLPFASVQTRKGALILVGLNILGCLYCVPWSHFFMGLDWVANIFIVDNWYWFGVMVAITLWYGASYMRLDRSQAWTESSLDADPSPAKGSAYESSRVEA